MFIQIQTQCSSIFGGGLLVSNCHTSKAGFFEALSGLIARSQLNPLFRLAWQTFCDPQEVGRVRRVQNHVTKILEYLTTVEDTRRACGPV